jgi:iron(III) transport system ATP-binding protein
MRIEVLNVTKAYGGVPVLESASLEAPDGATVALLGPSGSGKTTLLRLVAGLERPDGGSVTFDDVVVSRREWCIAPHMRGLGFAFQESALWPHMTVAENVQFGVRGRDRRGARARVLALLDQLELDGLADRYPDQLSGGQARRVGLARAMAPEPGGLLLDEPLTHLEPELRDRVLQVLLGHVSRTGATTVLVTHDEAEARAIGGRVHRMSAGRIAPAERNGAGIGGSG